MAIAAIAGLAAAGGAFAVAAAGTFTLGAFATAFAVGAGLSMVSRALMPTPSIGAQMSGTTTTVREPASTRTMVYGRARVGGSIVYLDSTGTDNEYMHMVIAVAGHAIDAYEEVWFNDEKVWDSGYVGSWGTYIDLNFHDGTQTTADANLVSRSTQWTTDHKLLDTAYIYVRLKYDAEQFANGLPNISTVVRGKKVYNPATSSTVWSQNPALIVRDYLLDSKYGLAEDAANINATSVSTAQTLCDQDVALDAGGTQKRYVCDGVVDTGNSREANIEALLSSMAGRLIHSGGEYFISGSAYVTPTVTIDESVLVGAISTQTKQSRRSIYNGVKGVFLSEEDNYILADYPAQISSTYSATDGDPIYLDMPLPTTTNNVRAQRLAKLALLQSRQQTSVSLPCNLAALKFKAGDNIMVTNAKIGWSAKVFQVLGYTFDLGSDGSIIVNVEAIETASAIYDWASSDEEDYLSGGEVSLYDGRTVAAPTSFTGTASSTVNLDGTIIPQIVSTWVSSADAFVVRYDYQWSTNNTDFNSIDVQGNQFTITPALGAVTYYTRVRAINELGIKSAFVTANVTAIGDSTAPALPTALSATAGYKSISLEWTNPADKDFSNTEVYRATSSGGTYAEVATVGGGFGVKAEFLNGGLADATAFYYKFKSVDYSGNKSAFTGVVSATTNAAAINGTDGTDGTDGTNGIDGTDGTNGTDGTDGTDGSTGAAGPRNADGYLYYSVSQANAPASPSATSYNFVTGSFGGLTANWSTTPPTNTGGDAKYWATYWHVTEATFGGTQTRTFNTPFNSVQFDGLVTFTNLNSELANASSTEITTINGGLIKTGTMEADRIRVDGVGIDVVTNGTQKTLQIGDDGVTTVKIDDLAVSSAKIANLAVTTGKIANLSVETLKIAGNAVTLPSSSYTSTASNLSESNGEVTQQTVTYTSEGGSVNIFASIVFFGYDDDQTNELVQVAFSIKRNGTLIGSATPIAVQNWQLGDLGNGRKERQVYAVSLKDVPPSGSVSYTLTAKLEDQNGSTITNNPIVTLSNKSLVTLEVKK